MRGFAPLASGDAEKSMSDAEEKNRFKETSKLGASS
jgi:hypothetical protein